MNDTKVYLLDSGAITIPDYMLFWNNGSNKPHRFPVYSVLIEHQEGIIIPDTGIGSNMVKGHVRQSKRQTLEGQLTLIGRKPADIDLVTNSHYHFDHVGGNRLCTCAKTICHKHELEAIQNPHKEIEAPAYRDTSFLEESSGYKPKVEIISGDIEIAKGVTLFETPGHTAGHCSLLVRLSSRRPMLFTGDACYARRSIETNSIPSLHSDPKAAYSSLYRLKDLAREHDAEMFFSHDKLSYPNYLKAPYYYS